MHYVLLPGLHGSARLFTPFVLAAPDGATFTTVAYPPSGPQDYDTLTAHARDTLPQNRSYTLVAESFSGPVAIRLAAERPRGLTRLVLVATFATAPLPRVLAQALSSERVAPDWLYGLLPMRTRVPRVFLGGLRRGDFDAVLREELARVSVQVFRQRMRAVLGVDVRAELTAVRAPVLYLRATHDWTVLATAARRIGRLGPDVAVRDVPGPHLLLQLAPQAAWRAIYS